MPDRNTQWIIGTFVVAAVAMSMQIFGLRGDMNQVRNEMSQLRSEMSSEMSQLRSEMRGEMNQLRSEMNQRFSEMNQRLESFDERLRNVEITLGKVLQRLVILERIVLPDPDEDPGPPQ